MRGLVQRPLPLEWGADQVRLRLNICRQAERLSNKSVRFVATFPGQITAEDGPFGTRPHSPHMGHAAVHAPHALRVTRAAPARASHPVGRGMRYLWPATFSLARHDGRSCFFGRGFASDRAGDDVGWGTIFVVPVGVPFS